MRVTGGSLRGRVLAAPDDKRIRPTADRVREALFSLLTHRLGSWSGVRVLDVFCGTGVLGIEALSRGAERVFFLDNHPASLRLTQANLTSLALQSHATCLRVDAIRPPQALVACELILLDPPYGRQLVAQALTSLYAQGWIAENAWIVIESDKSRPEPPPPGFMLESSKTYGRVRLDVLRVDVSG